MRLPSLNVLLYFADVLAHRFFAPSKDFGVQPHASAFKCAQEVLQQV